MNKSHWCQLSQSKPCNHNRLTRGCESCETVKRYWYKKLKSTGFHDIEGGLSYPRFTGHTPNPTTERAEGHEVFYNQVWLVYHKWVEEKRSRRDCLIAELYAAQEKGTGTVRGIMGVLKSKGLSPHCSEAVQRTLQEIRQAILQLVDTPTPR